jgi:hypothetical protein
MASPSNVQPLHGGDGQPEGSERFGQAITLIQAQIDEQMKITERLSAKGRQIFGLAAAFFAVAQTIAYGGLGLPHLEGPRVVVLFAVAACALVALLLCGHRVANLEGNKQEPFVKPEKIEEWARSGSDKAFALKVLRQMEHVANERLRKNKDRADAYDDVEQMARLALIFIAVEILIALIFRA